MGGVFGVVSKQDCVLDLFYGTDFHSHLGTRRGGLAVRNSKDLSRVIHSIENAQFRSKFDDDITKMKGHLGIGCISDTEDQPLIIGSHLGNYAIVTVGRINNITEIVERTFEKRTAHFSETTGAGVNATEVVASIINTGESIVEGIRQAQELIDGSCSLLLLTEEGIYAGRDRVGRTPLIIGEKDGSYCVTVETSAFPNLGYRFKYELGPGEVVLLTPDGIELKAPPRDELRICSFLWIYFGYPSSTYEGRNVEEVRNRCGAALARNDDVEIDCVAGIPDSGTAHAIGYANECRVPHLRPFVKYTPTWPRSFMPQNQEVRDLVARMKLIPIRELIHGKRLLFCEDSIVRGTQLADTIQRLFDSGAEEVHMRPACPPLIYGCRFLNFSRSKSELDLAGRRAISELVGHQEEIPLEEYADHTSEKYAAMVERIRIRLGLTTLQYQTLPDMIAAFELPKESVCTYCWDGCG
jgi:amidophosphoribosyltransferase